MTTTVGQAVDFNPANAAPPTDNSNNGFAARVRVKSSRFVKSDYDVSLGYGEKILWEWVCESTKGNEFIKKWSTGLNFDTLASISPDGKRLIAKSEEFSGIKSNSDAMHMLRSAITAGFPANKISSDASIFDGEAFLIADAKNPNARGSKVKPYPKTYYPQGWAALMAEYAAKQGSGDTYQPKTAPTPTQLSPDVLEAAREALQAIVSDAGGSVNRMKIPTALNSIPAVTNMGKEFRQKVTLALWDIGNLNQVIVGIIPPMELNGDTISFS